jgi:4-nitrophenyl phosphatase
VRVQRDEGVALILVDDVVGRRRDEREVIGGVADAGKRGEARNRAILADVNWVLDLDGVIWLADTPIPGSADAVAALEAAGERLVFVTNNSNPTLEENETKLADHGIDARDRVVSSAMAAATLVEPGERVLLCAGPGTEQALAGRGATIVRDGAADVVVVGFHREFDYERMRIASTAVRNGARLVATNDDATYPTPDGPIPGAGSILAGIERASGVRAVVAGKPYDAMAATVRSRLGGDGVVVGDRPDTDGRFARTLGYRFALVLTGVVTDAATVTDPRPDDVAPDLATFVERYLSNLSAT